MRIDNSRLQNSFYEVTKKVGVALVVSAFAVGLIGILGTQHIIALERVTAYAMMGAGFGTTLVLSLLLALNLKSPPKAHTPKKVVNRPALPLPPSPLPAPPSEPDPIAPLNNEVVPPLVADTYKVKVQVEDRTLKDQPQPVDFEVTARMSVSRLFEMIHQQLGLQKDGLAVSCNGKKLDRDHETLSDNGVHEGDTINIVVQKQFKADRPLESYKIKVRLIAKEHDDHLKETDFDVNSHMLLSELYKMIEDKWGFVKEGSRIIHTGMGGQRLTDEAARLGDLAVKAGDILAFAAPWDITLQLSVKENREDGVKAENRFPFKIHNGEGIASFKLRLADAVGVDSPTYFTLHHTDGTLVKTAQEMINLGDNGRVDIRMVGER